MQRYLDRDVKGFYRHYKGGLYRALRTARHSETGATEVIYEDLGGTTYARPYELFMDSVVVGRDGPVELYGRRFSRQKGIKKVTAFFQFLLRRKA